MAGQFTTQVEGINGSPAGQFSPPPRERAAVPPTPPTGTSSGCEKPAADVSELIERLATLEIPGGNARMLAASADKFNPSAFAEAFKCHLEEHKLLLTEEKPIGETTATLISRPAFDHTVFFADLRASQMQRLLEGTATFSVWGVHSRAHMNAMQDRGYTIIGCSFPGTFTDLPPSLLRDDAGGGAAAARTQLAIGFFKPITNARAESGPAQQIVTMWEEKTMDASGESWAPLYLWTAQARAASTCWKSAADAKETTAVSNHINRYGQLYCYVCTLPHPLPTQEQAKVGDLKKAAVVGGREHDEEEEAGGGEEGLEDPSGSKRRKRCWFDRACDLARERVEGLMDTA